MKKIFVVITFTALSLAEASSLSIYRASYKRDESKTAPQESATRVANIRKATGLTEENNSLRDLRAVLGNFRFQRSQSSSNFIRDILLKKAREFMVEDKYGQPTLFEPSSTLTMLQVEAKNKARFTEFCKKEFGPNLLSIAQQYEISILLKKARGDNRRDLPATHSILLFSLVNSKLSAKDMAALGSLQNASIEDGVLTRMKFAKADRTISVGFEMLVSVLTEEDYYFVETLGAFKDMIDERYAEKKKVLDEELDDTFVDKAVVDSLQPEVNTLAAVSKDLAGRIEGARNVNLALTQVSKEGLKALAGIFVTINSEDIPADVEMEEFNEIIATFTAPVLFELNEAKKAAATDKSAANLTRLQRAQTAFEGVSSRLDDYLYYREFHYSLSQFEEYLDSEAQKKGMK